MKIRQGYQLIALRGVQDLLDAHADQLGALATSGARCKLDAQVSALNDHVLAQSASDLQARGATQKQYALRRKLIKGHMAPVARIARAELPRTPELEALRMPDDGANSHVLHAAAIGMANSAEGHAGTFIEYGMPADFTDRLRAAADAMIDTVNARAQIRGARQGATRGLITGISNARKTVRVLDAFVSDVLHDDPALLTEWNAVKRPPAKPGRACAAGAGAGAGVGANVQETTVESGAGLALVTRTLETPRSRSQIVILKRGGTVEPAPLVFTDHGGRLAASA